MEKNEIGPWRKLRILGSGGFGQVTLWHNVTTGQRIAIKKPHDQSLRDAKARVKETERWCKEVEIMKKLNHTNIVSTLKIPSELETITSLPSLAMEYCANGDLRRVLNKPENCNGLREPEILDILRDVSSGLAYLHSCKIIHRDLKPDNIVLLEKDSRITYKLIDLGYAKVFDQSSLSQSFVGTIQYIAPELFMGKAYTSSVDYWSFGLLAHEIITGFRPFLPGFNPADWMKQIQNKSRDVIYVFEKPNGSIIFSSSISTRNHLSRCLMEDIEKWLRLALDWNGPTRGRDPNDNRLILFEELGNMLRKKVIKVFSVTTYETLAYEITAETDIADLRSWLKTKTDFEEDDQLLLLSSGKTLDLKGNLSNALKTETVDRNGISIFLFGRGLIKIRNSCIYFPQYIDELMENENCIIKHRHLKRCCADAIYFLQSQAMKYTNLLQGIHVKIAGTKQKTLAIESLYEDVGEEWNQVENYSQFLSFSHKIDLENYIHYRKAGKLKANSMVQKWIQNVLEVDKKIVELKNSFNKSEQKQLVFIAKQRCHQLENHLKNESKEKTPLDDIVKEGHKLWEGLSRASKQGREAMKLDSSVVHLIKKSVEVTDKLLNSQMLQSLFIKITEADENLTKFLTHLTTLLRSAKILKLLIENTQKERQKNVWNLIVENLSSENDVRLEKSKSEEKEATVDSEEKNTRKSDSSSGFLNGVLTGNAASIGSELSDASLIIADNNQLRYRIQDVQQMYDKMIKDIRSQKWSCIEED